MDDDDWYAPDVASPTCCWPAPTAAPSWSACPTTSTTSSRSDQTVRLGAAERGLPPVRGRRHALVDRGLLHEVGGFRSVRRHVDAQLIAAVRAAGGATYRTHGLGYVLRRTDSGHTWQADLDDLRDAGRAGHAGVPPRTADGALTGARGIVRDDQWLLDTPFVHIRNVRSSAATAGDGLTSITPVRNGSDTSCPAPPSALRSRHAPAYRSRRPAARPGPARGLRATGRRGSAADDNSSARRRRQHRATASASPPTPARPTSSTSRRPATLTIGTDSPAYEPWFVDNDPTNGKGFESAVAYAVAEQLGFTNDQVKWVKVPFNTSYKPGDKDFDFDINQISITPAAGRGRRLLRRLLRRRAGRDRAEGQRHRARPRAWPTWPTYKLGAQTGTTSLTAIRDTIKPDTDPAVFEDTNAAKQALLNGQVDGDRRRPADRVLHHRRRDQEQRDRRPVPAGHR